MKTLFKNARILLFGKDINIESGSLGVEGDKIAFIGAVPAGFEPDQTIECREGLLMPGFVNAHTHLPMSLFRGAADDLPLHVWLNDRIWPMESKMDGSSCFWGSLLSAAEMIRFGITSVNDMYFFEDHTAKAVAQSGLRALLCRAVITPADNSTRYMDEAVALFKDWNGAENGRIGVCLAPHAEYTCTQDTLREIANTADSLGALVHVHVSETLGEHNECKQRHGRTPVQLFDKIGLLCGRSMLAHCVYLEPEDIALVAQRGASILCCPQSNLKLASGIAPVPDFIKAGINVALGTDGAASNNNQNLLEELQLASLLYKGAYHDATLLSPSETIKMATLNGAKAMGNDTGRLVAGAKADLILFSTYGAHWQPQHDLRAHVAYSAQASDIVLTMVDGNILFKDGEYLTLDYDRILYETKKIADKLVG